MRIIIKIFILSLLISLYSCREDDIIYIPEKVNVATPEYTSINGFYLLNEGNMGMNKCTLDYYDYAKGEYTRNIYGNANPSIPKELGDVGNDIAIYGSKMYAVINTSNKVEVMNAVDATRIGQIDIPNCRYIKFHKGFAYITSYAGPVDINNEHKQIGYVAKVDTATLEIVDKCLVGYQPDGIEIVDNRIYVANSGGYLVPNYENTISVIDINSFTEIKKVEIALNLSILAADTNGYLWIASRGDYKDVNSRLYCYDVRKERIEKNFDIAVSNMALDGDSLYIIGNQWNETTQSTTTNYAIVDITKKEIVSTNFISDGTEASIIRPYGIIINPITKDILLSDAKSYVTPGILYCFDKKGVRKWNVRTGDIPAHFVFLGNNKNN
ncbi:MAG: YncE family protein [Muribaculaceae bacterium]|nr:YncE family protein [Muribaculaceae bacterium]